MPAADIPICHVFTIEDVRYVYDPDSNQVYEVDPVLADLLEGYEVSVLAGVYSETAVADARSELNRVRSEIGGFGASRQTPDARFEMAPPPAFDADAYASRLSHLCLTLTERCNLRCAYCLHGSSLAWIRPHRERSMSTETAQGALEYFAEHSRDAERPTVSFYGGEPLLEFDLIRTLVGWARRREWTHLDFSITTNGLRLNDEVIEFVVAERIRLQVSLDGPAELHDRHRRTAAGEPTHARVEENLTRLLRRDPSAADRLCLAATVAPPFDILSVDAYFAGFPPYREAGIAGPPSVQARAADLDGVDLGAVGFGDRQMIAAMYDDQLRRARDAYADALSTGRRDDLGPVLRAWFDPPLIRYHHRDCRSVSGGIRPAGPCLPGQRKLHVRCDGVFQPCESCGEHLSIGDVAKGIDPGRVMDLFSDFDRSLEGRCRDCWAHRMCSLCFLAQAPGNGTTIPISACDRVRREADAVLTLYTGLLHDNPGSLDFLENSVVS